MKDRLYRLSAYAVCLVLMIELTLAQCFLVGARPWGHALPVAAALAAVVNPLLTYVVSRGTGLVGGIALAVVWFLLVIPAGMLHQGEEIVIPGTGRGLALLVVGSLGLVIGIVLGATPRAQTRR